MSRKKEENTFHRNEASAWWNKSWDRSSKLGKFSVFLLKSCSFTREHERSTHCIYQGSCVYALFPLSQTFHQVNVFAATVDAFETPFCSSYLARLRFCLPKCDSERTHSMFEARNCEKCQENCFLHCWNAIIFNWCHCFECILAAEWRIWKSLMYREVKWNAWDTFERLHILLFEVYCWCVCFFFILIRIVSLIPYKCYVSVDEFPVHWQWKTFISAELHALACIYL